MLVRLLITLSLLLRLRLRPAVARPQWLMLSSEDIELAHHQIDEAVGLSAWLQVPYLLVGVRNQGPAHQEQRVLLRQVQNDLDVPPQIKQRRLLVDSKAEVKQELQDVRLREGLKLASVLLLQHYAQNLFRRALALPLDPQLTLFSFLGSVLGLECRDLLVGVPPTEQLHIISIIPSISRHP